MSADTLRAELARLRSDEAGLRKDLASQERIAADGRATANKEKQAAGRSKSSTTERSKLSNAERAEKKAASGDGKIADLSDKLAKVASRIATMERSLGTAEKSANRTRDMQDAARRRKEIAHARDLARLNQPPIQYTPVRPPDPEKLRVLYLTASPDATETERIDPDGTVVPEGVWLRVDREVRSVRQAIRGSKFRDLIEIQHMPAATPQDILDGLNDHRPHIVHFSGHGGSQALYLESDHPDADEGVDLAFGLLAQALAATSTPPRLIVSNACETLDGAEELLNAAPVVIAMSESILDDAASVFARQFYAAVASAQSVGAAIKQARVAMGMASLGQQDVPEHICRDNVDIDALVLVVPPPA